MEHEIIIEDRTFVFSTKYCDIYKKMGVQIEEKVKLSIGYKYVYVGKESYSRFLASKKRSEKIASKRIKRYIKEEKRVKRLNEKANR